MVAATLSPILDTIPSLRLRKDIWTHFPVCLIKLPYCADGRDRYAVQWHQKNLDMWCQKIPQYQNIVRIRMLHALAAAKDRWSLETPQAPGDLCVIAMNFSEEPRTFASLPDLFTNDTVCLASIENIKKLFPICWKSSNNRHSLQFHNSYVRALAHKHGVDEFEIRQLTLQRLMPALKEAGWAIIPPAKTNSCEICTIYKA